MTPKKIGAALCILFSGFLFIISLYSWLNDSQEKRLQRIENIRNKDDSENFILSVPFVIAGIYVACFRKGISRATRIIAIGFAFLMLGAGSTLLAQAVMKATDLPALLVDQGTGLIYLTGSFLLLIGSLGWLLRKESD